MEEQLQLGAVPYMPGSSAALVYVTQQPACGDLCCPDAPTVTEQSLVFTVLGVVSQE